VKLLLDQNLSPRLVRSLAATYPGTSHVREVGLHAVDDETIWAYAAEHGFVIVSKDADFHQRSFVLGPPPKVRRASVRP
jgi:predicted nuclease of predicted toxin-antitoxin system